MKIIWVKILEPVHASTDEVQEVAKMISGALKEKDLLKEYTYLVTPDYFDISIEQEEELLSKFTDWVKKGRKPT